MFAAMIKKLMASDKWRRTGTDVAILVLIPPEDEETRTPGTESGRRVCLERYRLGDRLGLQVQTLVDGRRENGSLVVLPYWSTERIASTRCEWMSTDLSVQHAAQLRSLWEKACMRRADEDAGKVMEALFA
jgi:hypothetical protein